MRREFPFLLPYLRRHLAAYVIGSVCVVASIFLKLRIPAFLKDAFDVLEGSAGRGQQAREEVFTIALWIAAYALMGRSGFEERRREIEASSGPTAKRV